MAKQWFFQEMGVEFGPLSSADVVEKVKRGLIQADTLVRAGQDGKWLAASQVKGLLDAAAPPPALPPRVKPAASAASAESPTTASASAVSTTSAVKTAATPDNVDDACYHFAGESGPAASAQHSESENFEFFQFVGFRHAISPALYDVLAAHVQEHGLSITQVTRRALAEFLGRKDLAEDRQPDDVTDPIQSQA